MQPDKLPPIWLIILIIGLPLLSETVYSPSLPDIAHSLATKEAWVEFTLTIYLIGFAVGTLVWGKLSDIHGRKPYVIAGLAIYISGCLMCYSSTSIQMLIISRFIQAFGGSVGSVLGQAICRDAFNGKALTRMYAIIGTSIAIFPAIGPVFGGIIVQAYNWPAIFLFLCLTTSIVLLNVIIKLPETHLTSNRRSNAIKSVALRMIKDTKVIGCGLLVAAANGLQFSYYAEGPFYLINLLGMSPSAYGMTFFGIATANMLGGIIVRSKSNHLPIDAIMVFALKIIIVGTSLLALSLLASEILSSQYVAIVTIATLMIISIGTAMSNSCSLAVALTGYRDVTGTASSLFGFFYYTIISLITLGMAYLHNGTLMPMPLYFFAIGLFMIIIFKKMVRDNIKSN